MKPSPLWEWLLFAAIVGLTLAGVAAYAIMCDPTWRWPL